MKKANILFHPIFLLSLIALLLNDFVLKYQFHNAFTGKLSDFAGLIVFACFFAYLFPTYKKWIPLIVGLLFIWWKSSWASSSILLFNQLSPFDIQRVVDYSDLCALLVLPLCHYLLNRESHKKELQLFSKVFQVLIICTSVFAITATSRYYHVCEDPMPKGSIALDKKYTIKGSPEEVKTKLLKQGFVVNQITDSNLCFYSTTTYSQLNFVPFYYPTLNRYQYRDMDTLSNVNFYLTQKNKHKSELHLINATLSNFNQEQDWRKLKELSRQCNYSIKEKVIQPLRHN